jgi:hypothetical protein
MALAMHRVFAGALVGGAMVLVMASCSDNTAGPSPAETPTAAPTPAPAQTPATTVIFDGKWTGTTNAGKSVSFRVLSGQLTDFTVEIDFGSECVYRARTPSTFDPVDAIFPIGNDGRLTFRFRDPALRTWVHFEFTAAKAVKGTVEATPLLDRVDCPGRSLNPPTMTPAATFTASRP